MRLAELQQLPPRLHELLTRHGACNPAVFGSVARDQARTESHGGSRSHLPVMEARDGQALGVIKGMLDRALGNPIDNEETFLAKDDLQDAEIRRQIDGILNQG
ncbi:hypothetical protein [Cyanobium gracile]|uniref:Uncharacterized protein n=1 Tax=Cyanobium gracile (strain ATCC 27147 / PCC 6307) TaxID=292564 RepID=K9P8N3_CYAGP|nr:hypothetical protein [Cyanobium gracile]AFY28919.1 hypothetical protein Cyagr_1779 [Cyanobium gracile PCC 6307]